MILFLYWLTQDPPGFNSVYPWEGCMLCSYWEELLASWVCTSLVGLHSSSSLLFLCWSSVWLLNLLLKVRWLNSYYVQLSVFLFDADDFYSAFWGCVVRNGWAHIISFWQRCPCSIKRMLCRVCIDFQELSPQILRMSWMMWVTGMSLVLLNGVCCQTVR